jgi:hypothetical protein
MPMARDDLQGHRVAIAVFKYRHSYRYCSKKRTKGVDPEVPEKRRSRRSYCETLSCWIPRKNPAAAGQSGEYKVN